MGVKGENYARLIAQVPRFSLFSHIQHVTPFSRVPQVALVARPAGGAPPFHLQIQIERATHNVDYERKRHALFGQAESQYLFS